MFKFLRRNKNKNIEILKKNIEKIQELQSFHNTNNYYNIEEYGDIIYISSSVFKNSLLIRENISLKINIGTFETIETDNSYEYTGILIDYYRCANDTIILKLDCSENYISKIIKIYIIT